MVLLYCINSTQGYSHYIRLSEQLSLKEMQNASSQLVLLLYLYGQVNEPSMQRRMQGDVNLMEDAEVYKGLINNGSGVK